MFGKLVRTVVGSRHDRLIRRLHGTVARINGLEAEFEALSDEAITAKTAEFRTRLQQGEGEDALLPEAFALAREAARRTLGLRHYDVQLVGGIVLHQGKIAEMRTGEGKTLVATLPAYLNAIAGRGVHVVTVNDYLASRDAQWMRPLYERLGLSVGVIASGQDPETKRAAYGADITYGTNNEFGFDYLRDNMAFRLEDRVQRGRAMAIVDEVDSILVDEARTPLIISGALADQGEVYQQIDQLVPRLEMQAEEDGPGHFSIDEKTRQVHLTEEGHQDVEALLTEAGLLPEGESLYDVANVALMHHVDAALRAHHLYKRDVHYIVQQGKVVIVDEFTGRTMPGRRWSEGLHQAVEAKEHAPIQAENQTLASITFQNYFRLYDKLAGMTGTADTEAFEFQQIYGLEVVVIPTNKPMIRKDLPDQIYKTRREKFNAVVEDIVARRESGQPVLVGTASIEASEYLSDLLRKQKVRHEVLNAKQHEREAEIIAQAGRPGAVTIATNMAGRGTDIVLGGSLEAAADADAQARAKQDWDERHQQVLDAGGLHIIGSERHESRRIDNQLRGRAGRQGDPGSSRFYLSAEDDLLRIFGTGRIGGLMARFGVEEGEPIEHRWLTRTIENAQRKVEGHNFDIRKQLLEYDDVANDQRRVIYEQRDDLLQDEDVGELVQRMRADVVEEIVATHVPPQSLEEQWDIPGLTQALQELFGLELPLAQWLDQDHELSETSLRSRILEALEASYAEKAEIAGEQTLREVEKSLMLSVLDGLWREHLAAMDYLRQGIHLRGYAQKNPKQEYKREAFEMFTQMLQRFKQDTISALHRLRLRGAEQAPPAPRPQAPVRMQFSHAAPPPLPAAEAAAQAADGTGAVAAEPAPGAEVEPVAPFVREGRKVGRNEPCPCGSGRKYKHCCGRLEG